MEFAVRCEEDKVPRVMNNPDVFEEEQIAELETCDDWGSAWEICKEMGIKWGGRGAGGRATNRCSVQPYDVVVEGCTMAYLGSTLLDRTTLRLLQGKKYGLIGRNGVGKSTLMRRIASGTLPGFPPHLRVAQVRQELPYISPEDAASLTPVEYVVNYNPVRRKLLKKIEQMETGDLAEETEENGGEEIDPEAQAELLCELYDYLEEEGIATARAISVLRDLGFGEKRRAQKMCNMSGGWRMRASIACALAQQPDLLLLDEPTNHLDLEGVQWLQSYLTGPATQNLTVLITSHDSLFLDNVCTDIIRFFQRQLTYYSGSYSDFEAIKHDKDLMSARQQATLDKARKHLEDSIRRMQIAAHKDTSGKANGAVASRKKKLARHGLEKNAKGHRFRAQHEATDGRMTQRLGSQCATAMGYKTGQSASMVEAADREWSMTLPNPVPLGTLAPMLQIKDATLGYRLVTPTDCNSPASSQAVPVEAERNSVQQPAPAVLTSVSHLKSIGSKSCKKKVAAASVADGDSSGGVFVPDATSVLERITLDIEQGSKVAIVGKNGAGKSTLLRTLIEYGESGVSPTTDSPVVIRGEVYKHPSLRIAYYQQLQQESLPYELTPLQHLMNIAARGQQEQQHQHTEQTLRAHLGSFGLAGDLALQQIGILSGGQKSRVVFAELTLHKPHLLLLDEPTNNLDLDAIRALKEAVQAYSGACIITSHDMAFVSGASAVVYHLANKRLTRLEGGVEQYKALVRETVERQKRNRT